MFAYKYYIHTSSTGQLPHVFPHHVSILDDEQLIGIGSVCGTFTCINVIWCVCV